MVLEAKEFNAAAMLPHDARKIMAINKPTNPAGK